MNHTKFKDEMGRYRTQSLFWELRHENYEAHFTLKDYDIKRDGKHYVSLKKLYMAYDHIPGFEYDFALDTLGSWDHWNKLCNDSIPLIKDTIKAWRDELDVRLKAQGLKALIQASRDNDPKGVQAAKYLAEKGYQAKRGRPSKEEVERELKHSAKSRKDLETDLERIGLKVMEGGQ